jgi:hypothetical protein
MAHYKLQSIAETLGLTSAQTLDRLQAIYPLLDEFEQDDFSNSLEIDDFGLQLLTCLNRLIEHEALEVGRAAHIVIGRE